MLFHLIHRAIHRKLVMGRLHSASKWKHSRSLMFIILTNLLDTTQQGSNNIYVWNIGMFQTKIWDFSLCAIIKDLNPLCAPEKIQRSSAPLLQLFRVLHATSVSSGSNAVKLHVWKDENALKFKYVINFFEHLNDFKWKNSKLESCRSRRDL